MLSRCAARIRSQCRQRLSRLALVRPNRLDRTALRGERRCPVAPLVGGYPQAAVGRSGIDEVAGRRERSDGDAERLREQRTPADLLGRGRILHLLPGRFLARRPFDGPENAGQHPQPNRSVRQRSDLAGGQVGQGLVQPGPGRTAIERTPHAVFIRHGQYFAVPRRDRQVPHSAADDRLAVESRDVGPGETAIVRAEHLLSIRIETAAVRRGGPHAARSAGDGRSRRVGIGGGGNRRTGLPSLEVRRLEDRSGSRSDVEALALGRVPHAFHRARGGRSESHLDGGITDVPPVGPGRARGLRPGRGRTHRGCEHTDRQPSAALPDSVCRGVVTTHGTSSF